MNNKAMFKDIGIIILSLVALIMLVIIVGQLMNDTNKYVQDAGCIASINQHISAVEALKQGGEKLEENIGVASVLILVGSPEDIPSIECDTKLIKSNAKKSEDAEKEILKTLVNTWSLFKEGNSVLYPAIEEENFCFVYSVLDFKNNLSVDLRNASKTIPITSVNKLYQGDAETVWDYFNNTNGFMSFNMLVDYPTVGTKKNFKFQAADWNFLKSDAKIDLETYETISANMPLTQDLFFDTSEPIAIVFQQFHKYSDVIILSSVYAVPYTAESMKKINCQQMPFEFEKFSK